MTSSLLDMCEVPVGPLADRLRGLVEAQLPLWIEGSDAWVVLPLRPDGQLAIVSREIEGERRGREIVRGFIGPALAQQNSTRLILMDDESSLRAIHLGVTRGRLDEVVAGLELMCSARLSRERHTETVSRTLPELLRDMRLSLALRDFPGATAAYEAVQDLAELSRENRRFLEIEYLTGCERWADTLALPYFSEIVRVRRPRLITECMLQALWFGAVLPKPQLPYDILFSSIPPDVFGVILHNPEVPSRSGARSVAYLTAVLERDEQRAQRILDSASSQEREELAQLIPAQRPVSEPEAPANLASLLAAGNFKNVVEAFTANPRVSDVDHAVEAVLELQDPVLAAEVLVSIERLLAGGFNPRPRLATAIDEVRALVTDVCVDWLNWAFRIRNAERWGDGARVARDHWGSWPAPVSQAEMKLFCDALVHATGGVNADCVTSALDVLLQLAVSMIGDPAGGQLIEVVLLLLANQDHASEPVRMAFLDLITRALEHGVDAETYRSLVDVALELWGRIAAPLTVDWALEMLEVLLLSPSPLPGLQANFASQVQVSCSGWVARLSQTQVLCLRTSLVEAGLPAWPPVDEGPSSTLEIWSLLNGRTLGVYSLVPNAGLRLESRLPPICSLARFTHNTDRTETAALSSLARGADYLIVDTWHAAHQATMCIDRVRPRSEQILPRRGGTPALLAALEARLQSEVDAISTS